jgi:hypothetical protein
VLVFFFFFFFFFGESVHGISPAMSGVVALASVCLISFVALYTSLAISKALEISSIAPSNAAPTLRSTLEKRKAGEDDEATCQHTISNGNVVADENGRVCRWSEMDADSGCCVPLPSDDARVIAPCTSCNERSCCAVYENCVACCVSAGAALFSSCVGRCRTHSGSMAGAREFADPLGKHCFGSYAAPAPQFDRFVQDSAAPSAAAPRQFALTFVLCVAIALPVLILR